MTQIFAMIGLTFVLCAIPICLVQLLQKSHEQWLAYRKWASKAKPAPVVAPPQRNVVTGK